MSKKIEEVTNEIILEMIEDGDQELIDLMIEHEQTITGVVVEDRDQFINETKAVLNEMINYVDIDDVITESEDAYDEVVEEAEYTEGEDLYESEEESDGEVLEESEENDTPDLLKEELDKMNSFFDD